MRITMIALGVVQLALGLVARPVHAQLRWTVEARSSLAWWQVNPHMSHLWATTCPEEPSWRPGEGHSGGWSIAEALRFVPDAGISDTVNVPLYPRFEAHDLCGEAVTGSIVAPDTIRWTGVHGEVRVRAKALVTGMRQRDEFAHSAILEAEQYPEIRFVIDSLTDVKQEGDTLTGTALGVFTLHGVSKPMRAAVTAFPEGGGLRVLGKFRMPPHDLISDYKLSNFALGLGVGVRIWKDLFMGVDLLLRQEARTKNPGRADGR